MFTFSPHAVKTLKELRIFLYYWRMNSWVSAKKVTTILTLLVRSPNSNQFILASNSTLVGGLKKFLHVFPEIWHSQETGRTDESPKTKQPPQGLPQPSWSKSNTNTPLVHFWKLENDRSALSSAAAASTCTEIREQSIRRHYSPPNRRGQFQITVDQVWLKDQPPPHHARKTFATTRNSPFTQRCICFHFPTHYIHEPEKTRNMSWKSAEIYQVCLGLSADEKSFITAVCCQNVQLYLVLPVI